MHEGKIKDMLEAKEVCFESRLKSRDRFSVAEGVRERIPKDRSLISKSAETRCFSVKEGNTETS